MMTTLQKNIHFLQKNFIKVNYFYKKEHELYLTILSEYELKNYYCDNRNYHLEFEVNKNEKYIMKLSRKYKPIELEYRENGILKDLYRGVINK